MAFPWQSALDPIGKCDNISGTLIKNQTMAVAFGETARTLSARHDGSPCADRRPDVIAAQCAVRRLTPRECERLQGFPDDWTLIPYRNKPAEQCPDGPRYKALGNSMAVPVMRWIGERIKLVEQITGDIGQ
jgi:DNA (cytosine-5)-methyltransferase 1